MSTIGTKNYYVYILTNKHKTVLYIGVTNDLDRRLHEHKNPESGSRSFTKRYNCYYLLHYEHFFDINQAIAREKELKGWSRKKKEKLITKHNREWSFLLEEE